MVAARRAGDRAAPALVSEVDLFLRLCPAPTVGVTGTKGKTTTSALTAAILAADPDHPVELGGNIGRPLVDLLPALTPDHRVVIELSELQLPTLSRGTTVAVYTNVTSDHLDRHGSLEAYRRVKRLLAELVDPAGALVLNADDPTVAGYADASNARAVIYGMAPPMHGGIGLVDGWIVADGVEPLPASQERPDRGQRQRPDPAGRGARGPGAPQRRQRDGRRRRRPPVRRRPGRDPASSHRFHGVEHRLETVAIVDGVRFVNDSMGTQPDAVEAALRAYRAPDRAHRRWPRQGRGPVGPRVGRGRPGGRGDPHRGERPDPRTPVPRRGPGDDRTCRFARGGRRPGGRAGPRARERHRRRSRPSS